jgi:hypothetical protein
MSPFVPLSELESIRCFWFDNYTPKAGVTGRTDERSEDRPKADDSRLAQRAAILSCAPFSHNFQWLTIPNPITNDTVFGIV